MSTLNKLEITGVRAFGPRDPGTIKFLTPLTLIVGTNGSGKTTIIECLKFVTTGDTPPGLPSKEAFIHDVKLVGEQEVQAQVKLSFMSVGNLNMTAARKMAVSVSKQKGKSFKALEGSVTMKQNGEKVALSTRVAEMNTMMPRYLGVSRAILDNVVFCHQDESLWPLEQANKLKERFDKIFEADKYTKAVDTIRLLQKKKRAEMAQLQTLEGVSKNNKDRGRKMETQMGQLHDECERLRADQDELEKQIKELHQLSTDAWQRASRADMVVVELKGKYIERDSKQESVQSLRSTLHELSETDEELQTILEEYDERARTSEQDHSKMKQEYLEVQQQLRDARARGIAKERECGAYEEQKQSFDRSVAKRQRLVKETAQIHNIWGFDDDVDDVQARDFLEKLSKMARDQAATHERSRRETREELERAQKVLNQVYQQRSALNQSKDNARKAMATHDNKLKSLQTQMDRLSYDEGQTATLNTKFTDAQDRLEKAKSHAKTSSWRDQIEAAEVEVRGLEERKEKLDAELVEATRSAGDTAQLDIRQKELNDSRRGLETMVNAHGEKFESILGIGWTAATIEADFQRVMDESNSAVAQAERQRDGAISDQKQIRFQLNKCRTELAEKETAVKTARKAIKDALDCEPQDFPEEVKKLEQSRDVLKSDHDSIKLINDYFEQCIKAATEHKACRTCTRALKDKKELDIMLRAVEKERQKFHTSNDDKAELQEFEDILKAAREASSDFDTWERLTQKEIPLCKADATKLSDREAQLGVCIDEYDAIVRDKTDSKRELDAIARNVQKIAKYNADISKTEVDIKDMQSRQKDASRSRGLEIIQSENKDLTDKMRHVKAQLSRHSGERDRSRREINSLELETRDLRNNLSDADHQMKAKLSLDSQLEEQKTLNAEQRESIKSLESELEKLVPQQLSAQEKYDDISRRGQAKDREMQAETTKLNSSVGELKLANQDIEAYHARGGPEQLARGRREAATLKSEEGRLEQDQSKIVQRVKQLEDLLRGQSDKKRQIADNQRFRRDMRQLKAVTNEIEELEQHNAQDDKKHWTKEATKYEQKRQLLVASQHKCLGELQSKDAQLGGLIADYDTDYKDAAFEYKKAHILVETTRAAIDDLGRYYGALDQAIMRYHSMKMAEINRIIEDLWRRTYQGTDVDTILIKSETETQQKGKNYNYRVCMVKRDVELDMRGRCSAGQKVLACIIIRLALAESFGVSCGMIALDEPTTNLDTENIQALARSLSEIIRVRRAQHNFQLIVITHDEDFLRQMNCSDYTDYYYRVSRDVNQKSKIERNSIAEVSR